MTTKKTTTAFEIGDVVQLKSGGPRMTVGLKPEQRKDGIAVSCDWFADDHHNLSGEFYADQLREIVSE